MACQKITLSIFENFIPYLLGVGDYRAVAFVLRELRTVLDRAREVLPEHRRSLQELPGRLSQPAAIGQLLPDQPFGVASDRCRGSRAWPHTGAAASLARMRTIVRCSMSAESLSMDPTKK